MGLQLIAVPYDCSDHCTNRPLIYSTDETFMVLAVPLKITRLRFFTLATSGVQAPALVLEAIHSVLLSHI